MASAVAALGRVVSRVAGLSGVPAGGAGRPDFAASGRPGLVGRSAGAGSSSSSGGYGSSASSNGASRGNSANAGSFPSTSNAGGRGLSYAAPAAQPTLQVLDQAFSNGETLAIREYFAARAHANKPETPMPSSPYNRALHVVPRRASAGRAVGQAAEPPGVDLCAHRRRHPAARRTRRRDRRRARDAIPASSP